MFDVLVEQLASHSSLVSRRDEGVAFFGVAKDLYRLENVTYICVNLPVVARSKHYTHCVYSDTAVSHYMSQQRIEIGFMKATGLCSDTVPCDDQHAASLHDEQIDSPDERRLTFTLRPRHGEVALFAVSAPVNGAEWPEQKRLLVRECRILASYFHSHILRINGHNSEDDILMSARELDCLRWTAAGKTAWEASVILGISERTVRFHLNAAREKLNCATTTQAVAKAIVNQLIDV
jgi:DNA-binding CsgD family transcriptional regulator